MSGGGDTGRGFLIQILDSKFLLFLHWRSVFNVLTKYVPQVANLEIVEADFESKNNSLSSDLFLMARLKTAKNSNFNTF